MSMPVVQQPPPPAVAVTELPYYNSQTSHASIAPVVAVLLVIIILGIVAGMIGRLCTGRRMMALGHFDIESRIETKCSSCIDGRIYPPPSPRSNASSATFVPTPIQRQPLQESKQEDQSPQTPTI